MTIVRAIVRRRADHRRRGSAPDHAALLPRWGGAAFQGALEHSLAHVDAR